MSSIKNTGAMENLFDAEQTAASLLESVKVNVENTVKTVDEAATLENKLSEEAAQFNTYLTTMSNAIRKCERGEISREEMLAECAPCVTALKEKCAALKLTNTKITGDDITEDEIAMLREYIVGCKDIVAARKKDLQDSPAAEGVLAGLANFEPATEASMYKEIRQSTEAKTANQLYKQAKKLYGLGSKEKALEYLKKAQGLYEGCLEKVKKSYKLVDTERSVKSFSKTMTVEDKYKTQTTESLSGAYLVDYFEDRIDSCKALEMQWNNKAGKSTYAETKAQLKAERKQVRAEARAAKKAAKAAAKNSDAEGEATESMIGALESLMDSLELELSIDCALEAEGEGEEPKASGIGAKFRAAFAKLKKAKVEGDETTAAEAEREVEDATRELSEAEAEAETPEEKAKLSKAAKIGLAAAATAAAAVGLVAVAKTAKNAAEKEGRGFELKKSEELILNMARAAKNAKDVAVGRGSQAAANAADAAARVGGKVRNTITANRFRSGKYKPGKESFVEECDELEASLESLMDSLELDLSIDCALEAEGEGEEPKASGIGAKFRAAFAKLKKAKVEGDEKAADEAEREVAEVNRELSEAEAAAETPEEKAKLSKAAKIGLAAAATAAAAVGLVAVAKTAKGAAEKEDRGFELKKSEELILKMTRAIGDAKDVAIGRASQMDANVADAAKRIGGKVRNTITANRFRSGKYKPGKESFLADLAFGLEGVCIDGEDCDDDEVDELDGKAFDEGQFDDANESELDDLATEAAIAVMMAEDGIDDSDLI